MFLKRIFFIFLGIFVVISISKGWHILTSGFQTNKILPPRDCICSKNELPKNLDEEFLSIFDQEYKYLGKGCQAYVFESADKKYVVKFLRHHKYKPPFWINFGVIGKGYRERIVNYKKGRVKNAFQSYLMSYEDLKEETGVVYLHLGETNYFNRILTIRDRFLRKRFIELDKMHFVVQIRVNKLGPKLLELSRKNKILEAKVLIDGYFNVIKKRCLKGIKNVDHSGYLRNMGYIGERIFEMDLGGYRKREVILTKKGFENEFTYFAKRFKKWGKEKAPNLEGYIENRANKVLKECSKQLLEK
jgi:hypothetical protein